ncbi:MAG: flagellar filament capping protein FliD, partial [Chloroflexi bacterium]|nr:flagellar filament capping protein FliD [Chloroflexota bacterium]
MATDISAINSFFSNLITETLQNEAKPIQRLTNDLRALEARKSVYSTAGTRLSSLLTSVNNLATDSTTNFLEQRSASVTEPSTTGAAVFTASATDQAIAGTQRIAVTTLAKAHSVGSSTALEYSDQQLGLSGVFTVGGAANRSISSTTTPNPTTISGFSTADLTSGLRELGSDQYYVEVRNNSSVYEFRLVNSQAQAVAIRKYGSDSATETTSAWQAVPAGQITVDTGRGLKFTFGGGSYTTGSKAANAASATYVAKGAAITVSSTHTLVNIAALINRGTFAEGNEVTAGVVDRRLILTANNSGTHRSIVAAHTSGTDNILLALKVVDSGGAYANVIQAPTNAAFTVDGISITRSQNSGLTDVISGVTLNLAADAAGKNAALVVTRDTATIVAKLKALVADFNAANDYVTGQTTITKTADKKYTSGTLAQDSNFVGLRRNLITDLQSRVSGLTGTTFTAMSDLGVNINTTSLTATLDEAKLAAAFSSDSAGARALVNAVADRLQARLKTFTATTKGVVDASIKGITTQISDVNSRITKGKLSITERETSLKIQYGRYQAQIMTLLNTQ